MVLEERGRSVVGGFVSPGPVARAFSRPGELGGFRGSVLHFLVFSLGRIFVSLRSLLPPSQQDLPARQVLPSAPQEVYRPDVFQLYFPADRSSDRQIPVD